MEKLTPREIDILLLLSKAHNSAFISQKMGIARSCVYQHISNLRRKTGIQNLDDPREVNQYLNDPDHPPLDPHGPTRAQLRVLRRLAQGMSYRDIATELKLSLGTVMNTASQARKRAGLTPAAQRRALDAQRYLDKLERPPAPLYADPMSDPAF